eukprot:TRINITY_DN43137_c0_g1_i1.p1 TRINITY_DN43137_c0_g1~~TRINITY_DN43137_c0_g1_i1.p1  ORF type:complete len:227 (-),score=55.38 TRINITY_DN43137_c0_g1_i1:178-756(-)
MLDIVDSLEIAANQRLLLPERAAAFAQRLGALAIHLPPALNLPALACCRRLILSTRLGNSLLSEPGGTSLFNPKSADPDTAAAMTSPLWAPALLCRSYHPFVCQYSSRLLTLGQVRNVPSKTLSMLFDTSKGGFNPQIPAPPAKKKKADPKPAPQKKPTPKKETPKKEGEEKPQVPPVKKNQKKKGKKKGKK